MRPRTGGMRIPRRWGDVVATAGAAMLVIAPAFVKNRGVGPDLVNHLWAVRFQAQYISDNLSPSYFVNASTVGVFYPLFVFYGGTLYAAVGALVAVFGHPRAVFFASTAVAVIASYGALVWLSRQLGARSWRAHAPAIAFVASAYYVTNLWGRSDWPEFMATSTIPLLVASGWRLMSAPRLEPLPAALLVIATVFFAGSHNVTLAFGSLALAAGLILLWLAVGRALAPGGMRRLAQVAGLLVLGVAVNAWFLIPDLISASETQIGAGVIAAWATTGFFNTPGIIFDPLRAVPAASTTPGLFVQAPDWFLFWVVGASIALWSSASGGVRRAAGALVLLLLSLLAMIMIGPLWDGMPFVVRAAQFPYRANTYVALCSAGLVLVGVVALERTAPGARRRLMRSTLIGAMGISAGLAIWQVWDHPADPAFYSNLNRAYVSTSTTPVTWPGGAHADYADSSQRIVATQPTAVLTVEPAQVTSDHVKVTVVPPPGPGPFATDISAGPYAVQIGGSFARVGRTAAGTAVVRRISGRKGPATLSLSPAGGAVTVGRVVSLVASLILAILLARAVGPGFLSRVQSRRRRKTTRSDPLIYAAGDDERARDQAAGPPR